jgi:PAS domain S-box-containing protein
VTRPKHLKELQLFSALIQDLACVFQPEGVFQMLNPAWEQVMGWTVEDLQPSAWIDFVHPDDLDSTQERFRVLLNQAHRTSIVNFENRWLHKDGSYRCLGWRVSLGDKGLLYGIAREISPINPELQQLKIELKQAQEELRRSEEHFSKAFRANLIAACITTWQEGRFREVNDNFLKLFGYCREELIGYTARELGLWANIEHRPKVFQMLHEQKYVPNLEVQFRIKSGEIRDGVASYETIELNGETCVLSQVYDVTKYKRAEETIKASLQEKEVLLKEIHHRVKNNLQVISSLLDLQSIQVKEPKMLEMFRDSCNRVRSMALVHENLYQSKNYAKVNFSEYIETLIMNLFQVYRVNNDRINLEQEIDVVALNIDTAIPCGLIINELVSNALKHAFSDKKQGTISILFKVDEAKHYTLIVRDNGIGLRSSFNIDSLNTLGLQLVDILTNQLEGTLEIDSRIGTEFRIKFPYAIQIY